MPLKFPSRNKVCKNMRVRIRCVASIFMCWNRESKFTYWNKVYRTRFMWRNKVYLESKFSYRNEPLAIKSCVWKWNEMKWNKTNLSLELVSQNNVYNSICYDIYMFMPRQGKSNTHFWARLARIIFGVKKIYEVHDSKG